MRRAEGLLLSSKDLVGANMTFSAERDRLRRTRSLLMIVIIAGVHHVFETSFSRTFSLLESQREFVERFKRKEQDRQGLPMLTSACPGIPLKALFG